MSINMIFRTRNAAPYQPRLPLAVGQRMYLTRYRKIQEYKVTEIKYTKRSTKYWLESQGVEVAMLDTKIEKQ